MRGYNRVKLCILGRVRLGGLAGNFGVGVMTKLQSEG